METSDDGRRSRSIAFHPPTTWDADVLAVRPVEAGLVPCGRCGGNGVDRNGICSRCGGVGSLPR